MLKILVGFYSNITVMKPSFAVLIDLSGTLFIDEIAIPGASQALQKLINNQNFAVKFVTNTTKESSQNLLNRLHRVGFDYVEKESVFTSLTAARKLIDEKNLSPMLLLEPEAMEEFEGVKQENLDSVVVGLAPSQFNFEKLNEAFRLLHSNFDASLIGIHKGRYYERNDGLALGPGPFVEALEYSSSRKAIVVGKPERHFYESAVATLGIEFSPNKIMMIGDDVRDDVNGALAIGYKAILVKTGKYREGDETKILTFKENGTVFESVTHAIEAILENDGKKFFGC